MSHPFEMWSDRIAAADTEEARRALLVEAARWRAQHLSDVPAMRRATFVVSRLHAMLGDKGRAVSEAHQLLSLCQTAPEASAEEIEAARGYLQTLGEAAPKLAAAPRAAGRERPARGRDRDTDRQRERERDRDRTRAADKREPAAKRRDEAPDAAAGLGEARRAATSGDWARVLALTEGAKGAGAAVLRAYARLSAAEAGELAAVVDAVRGELGRAAGLGGRAAGGAREVDADDPLVKLLGAPIPARRAARIQAIEDFAAAHPDQLDELAGAALRHHVVAQGVGAPAPWLVGIVAQAMARGDAPQTQSAIGELRAASAVAVHAYDEWPFERILRLMRRARQDGVEVTAVRRGVLARGEPDDRKLWTLRAALGGSERMLVVAPHASEPYPAGKAEELAQRLLALCPRTMLLATGSGNAGLRQAAAAAGVTVQDADADDAAILATLGRTEPPAAAHAAPETAAPDRLTDLLRAETVDILGLTEAIRSFRRPDRALRLIQKVSLDDAHAAAVLKAIDAATEADQALPEATTLAIRAAASGSETRALLLQPGSVAERFGGPDVGTVLDVAAAVLGGGWELFRVLRGPTRRECQAHPALETLSASMAGLWRLLVRKGDRRGEVWFVSALAPEGRAGVPLLLLDDWQRVVVLPIAADLLAWWRSLGNPAPTVGWTGGEADEVLTAVEGFAAREPRPEMGEVHRDEGASPTP